MPVLEPLVLALDTETTGKDFFHGTLPFFVTFCNQSLRYSCAQWNVDPITRIPIVPEDDLIAIRDKIDCADYLVLHNSKFDVHALAKLFEYKNIPFKWDWGKVHDTLIASHILASNQPHDLTSLSIQYLGKNISPHEVKLQKACQQARNHCRTKAFQERYGEWRIAKEGLPEMPSAKNESKDKGESGLPKSSPWAYDMWLPRAIAKVEEYKEDHEWWTVLSEYSNIDSGTTILLWKKMEKLLKDRGYWHIYLEKMKVLPILYGMEDYGMTICPVRTKELQSQFISDTEEHKAICVNLSDGHLDDLPEGSRSKALDNVLVNILQLKSTKFTKTGNPSYNAQMMEEWVLMLDTKSKQWNFINNLLSYRKRKTALQYIDSYMKYWVDTDSGMMRLHSSVNPTGTDTTRFSSSNPNSQQYSKKKIGTMEGSSGKSARYMLGPAPGREWWPMDFENIELRIPAYVSGEPSLIDLFERAKEPPFYGSQHLLNFSIMYADIWEDAVSKVSIDKAGPWCKDTYKSTYYQWCKNTDFALQYNCGEATCDRTSRRKGTFRLLKSKFAKLEKLNQSMISIANKMGYIETMPNKSIGAKHGYPLLCRRSARGGAVPTVPLSYFVQGIAGDCGMRALIRCENQLIEWRNEGFDAHIIAYIHDELVFDMPAGGKLNLWRANKLRELMCLSGEDIGVPLSVSMAYCPNNWGEEVKLEMVV